MVMTELKVQDPVAPGSLEDRSDAAEDSQRSLDEITPPLIFEDLQEGVLGQDRALRFVSVAIYKHVTGEVSGNFMLIGSSGTGKTTIMNNIQRLYHEVPEYEPFRAVTIINANLLVDSDRLEFRPDRLINAVEQRARALLGDEPTPAELKQAIERATICVDEIDKMSSVVAGKPNPIGVVLQQGLLTLMEGEHLAHRTHAWVDGTEKELTVDIDTSRMMFICGGAFEGIYDQVYQRVTKPGSGETIKKKTVKTAEGQIRIESRFSLADFLKLEDLFEYGMVPQFMARFDKVVLLNDLSVAVLKEILMRSYDSPYVRSRQYFRILGIELEIEDLAAALIAERAAKASRTGARSLRPIFTEIVNPIEFDPEGHEAIEETDDGRRIVITADMVRAVINGE